jgi:magnesium-transporting ATPase (P-type)
VGEIILLKKNEQAPADLLILDSKDEICLISERASSGDSSLVLKRSLDLTKGWIF